MRCLVALFLLTVFAFQSSWAVAAAYCQHEQAREAAHFGHHAHEHGNAGDADADGPDTPAPLGADLDCHACHSCCTGLVSRFADAVAVEAGVERIPPLAAELPHPPGFRLERPNWLALA